MSQCISGRTKWQRVSRRHRCPVCGHTNWCLITGPADSPDAVICARVESQKRVGDKGAGWLHRLREDDDWRQTHRRRRVTVVAAPEPTIDFDAMASECELALGPLRRGVLAADLGISPESLSRLQVGWSERHRSFTFPMRDADGNARGIRLRKPDGSKWAVKGSRQALFLPRHFPIGDMLVVCEGATDTAAMLLLCFDAVGRPSCNGGVGLIVDLVRLHQPHEIVILADADPPGQRGAHTLAAALVAHVAGVRTIFPPTAVKDARQWVQSGADRLDILDAIDVAPILQLRYSVKAVGQ